MKNKHHKVRYKKAYKKKEPPKSRLATRPLRPVTTTVTNTNQVTTQDLAYVVLETLAHEGLHLQPDTILLVLAKYERAILEKVVTGKEVKLELLGTINTRRVNHVITNNPKTGGRLDTPEHMALTFTASKLLGDAVRYSGSVK